jgi:hypothetical protein
MTVRGLRSGRDDGEWTVLPAGMTGNPPVSSSRT